MSNLLRNGDLELGTTEFFTAIQDCVLSIDNIEQKSGNYCLKVTRTNAIPKFRHDDYIDLWKYNNLLLNFYHKTTTPADIIPYIEYYDSNLSLVKSFSLRNQSMTYTYRQYLYIIPKFPEVDYARLNFLISTVGESVYYLDQISLYEVEKNKLPKLVLHPMQGIFTTSGSACHILIPLFSIDKIRARVSVSNVSGTSPTLNIFLATYGLDNVSRNIDLFGTITEPGDYTTEIAEHLGLDGCIYWFLGGTSPYFEVYLELELWF